MLKMPMFTAARKPRGLPPEDHAAGSLQSLLTAVERIMLAHDMKPLVATVTYEGGTAPPEESR